MRLFILKLAILYFSVSCSSIDNQKESPTGPQDTGGQHKVFYFTTVSEGYSSSSLYQYNLQDGKISKVLTGQSGDPAVFKGKNHLYFFNRSSGNSNFRRFDLSQPLTSLPQQLKTPVTGMGAPQDMLELDDDKILLADLGGSLTIMAAQTGEKIGQIAGDWDTNGGPFLPVSLHATYSDDKIQRVFVLHQGRGLEFGTYNNSQQIFLLEPNQQGGLEAIDLDSTKAGIQGVPLRYSNGEKFLLDNNQKLLIVGICYGEATCKKGVEAFDPQTLDVKDVLDLSNTDFYGGHFAMGKDNHIIGTVYYDASYADFRVVELDLTTGNTTEVHQYPASSTPASGLFFDPTSQVMYVGDRKFQGQGFFTIYNQGTKSVVEVAGHPYNGVFSDR